MHSVLETSLRQSVCSCLVRKLNSTISILPKDSNQRHFSVGPRSQTNHYDMLGVSRTATKSQIKESFVKLSKKFHPDKNPGDPKCHEKFVAINKAYTILSKPSSRTNYDFELQFRTQRAAYDIRAPNVHQRSHMYNHIPVHHHSSEEMKIIRENIKKNVIAIICCCVILYYIGYRSEFIYSYKPVYPNNPEQMKKLKEKNLKVALALVCWSFCGFILFYVSYRVGREKLRKLKVRNKRLAQEWKMLKDEKKNNGEEDVLEWRQPSSKLMKSQVERT